MSVYDNVSIVWFDDIQSNLHGIHDKDIVLLLVKKISVWYFILLFSRDFGCILTHSKEDKKIP